MTREVRAIVPAGVQGGDSPRAPNARVDHKSPHEIKRKTDFYLGTIVDEVKRDTDYSLGTNVDDQTPNHL